MDTESTIFFGGPILTLRDEQPKVEAIAIRDGHILALGDRQEVFKSYTPRTRLVDLRERTLMPGFIVPHVHLAWSALIKYRLANGEQLRDEAWINYRVFEQTLEDSKKLLREWARQGCTTVYDVALGALWDQEEVRLFLEIASDPVTPVRLRAALVPTDDLPRRAGIKPNQGNDRLCFTGISFWVDGVAPGVIGAAGKSLPLCIESGRLNYNEDELRIQMQGWHIAGWQLIVHANSDQAIEQAFRVSKTILTESPRPDHRHRIEGCTVISGAPATPVNPLRQVETAVMRMIEDGADQRVMVNQALKTVILQPAHQCFLEDKVGSLAVGKVADLVVLDQNPCTVEPSRIAQIQVIETYLAGVRQIGD